MALSPVTEKFILHWGEMGPLWGVSRSVAQIHALLYLSERPLTAEHLSETLKLARSNVSTSLKELLSWGVIRQVQVLGDRREHFESLVDVWEMLRLVLDERRKREIEPTIRMLRECSAACQNTHESDLVRDRIDAIKEFFETSDNWYRSVRALPNAAIKSAMKMGGLFASILPRKDHDSTT